MSIRCITSIYARIFTAIHSSVYSGDNIWELSECYPSRMAVLTGCACQTDNQQFIPTFFQFSQVFQGNDVQPCPSKILERIASTLRSRKCPLYPPTTQEIKECSRERHESVSTNSNLWLESRFSWLYKNSGVLDSALGGLTFWKIRPGAPSSAQNYTYISNRYVSHLSKLRSLICYCSTRFWF